MDSKPMRYRISNSAPRDLVIHLEPWGEVYVLAPGEEADLLVDQPASHPLEWDFGEGKLVISSLGEADASLELWREGARVSPR